MESGQIEKMELLSGKGFTRWSKFSKDQMYAFITLRSLAASPLMMGGDLPTLDDFSLMLITNKDMLECNQNGVMGHLVHESKDLEVWQSPKKGSKDGWIGVFNRSDKDIQLEITKELFGLDSDEFDLYDIWHDTSLRLEDQKNIPANGVIFIRFTKV